MKYIKRITYILFATMAISTQSTAGKSIVLIPVDDLMIPIYVDTGTNTNVALVNKTQLLSLVNQARTEGQNCGDAAYAPVDLLVWSDTIERAALAHSLDMDTNDFFSHTGSDGSDVGTRFDRVGYVGSANGENIAFGYETEESVIAAWLNSPGHCTNIMSPLFTEMGVSKVGTYWTQDFGDTF